MNAERNCGLSSIILNREDSGSAGAVIEGLISCKEPCVFKDRVFVKTTSDRWNIEECYGESVARRIRERMERCNNEI